MSQKPETRFAKRVKDALAILPHTWCVKTQMVATRGIPDFLACIGGQFVALELKKDLAAVDNAPKRDPLQIHVLARIAESGGTALLTCPELWPVTLAKLREIALRHGGVPQDPEDNQH